MSPNDEITKLPSNVTEKQEKRAARNLRRTLRIMSGWKELSFQELVTEVEILSENCGLGGFEGIGPSEYEEVVEHFASKFSPNNKSNEK